jgi:orotate phosphoribosyltransferase
MKASFLGKALADKLHDVVWDYSPANIVVVSPAMGGIIIGQEVARAIGTERTHHVPHMFLERTISGFQLRRGFELNNTKFVIIVEDVVTTGVSTAEAMAAVRLRGANVIAVASIINRATDHLPFGNVPYEYLLKVDAQNWYPEQCPLCVKGKEVEKPGSRGEIPRLL